MRRISFALSLPLLVASLPLLAQTTPSATDLSNPAYNGSAPNPAPSLQKKKAAKQATAPAPFSRLALGAGVSAMGIHAQAAINANRFLNLRATGSYFNYTVNNINISGFNVSGKPYFAAAGASLDFYPFPSHGLRLSPGVLFYNQNNVTATMTATGGTSFTLNNITYYSSASNPVTGVGSVGLHTQKPAPSMTIGWGNMIPRNGGHWSFPVEVGAAYIGQPAIAIALTGGQVCSNSQGTIGCTNVVGNSSLNANLQAQIAKYQKDLDPLRFYPIVSFGVAYNFRIR